MKTEKFDIDRLFNEPDHFLFAPKHLREKKTFIKKCSDMSGGDTFFYVDEKFKQDEEFIFENASLRASPSDLKHIKGYIFSQCVRGHVDYFDIPTRFRYFDKDIATAVAYYGATLEYYSGNYAFNNTTCFFFNSRDSYNYYELTQKQQNNPYLAMAGITKIYDIDVSNNKKLMYDRKFCQMYVIYKAEKFDIIPKKFQMDAKFVQHALARNPDLYPYLDIKFKNKKKYLKLALTAQRPDISHLNHSKYGIWVHRTTTPGDLLLAAPEKFHTTPNLYHAASLGLSTLEGYKGPMSAEISRKLVEIHRINYNALDDKFKNNDLIIRTTIRKYPRIIQKINPTHQHYLAYVKIALQLDGGLIEFVPKELWTDELICTVLKNSGYAYSSFSNELKNNEKWIKIALKQAGEMYTKIPVAYKSNPEIIWIALRNKPAIYEHLPTEFKNDLEICEYVYSRLPRMMEFMPKRNLVNTTLLFQALMQDGLAWVYLPHHLKRDLSLKKQIFEQCDMTASALVSKSSNELDQPDYFESQSEKKNFYYKLSLKDRADLDLALISIQVDIDNIYFLPVSLMKNDEFMEKVYKIFRKECKRQWTLFKHNCDQLIA